MGCSGWRLTLSLEKPVLGSCRIRGVTGDVWSLTEGHRAALGFGAWELETILQLLWTCKL